MIFDYFYGEESEAFSFFRIPRLLISDPSFKNLSTDAKLLYGLLLDRMALSAKNGWYDDNGRVYIFYTVEEIRDDLNCGHEKAGRLLRELDSDYGIGLIERVKRGQGKPTIIYVKQFFNEVDSHTRFRPPINGSQQVAKPEVKTSDFQRSRKPETRGQDIRKSNGSYINNNHTDQNKTYQSYTDPSIRPSPVPERDEELESETDETDRESIEAEIMEQIDFEALADTYGDELVENIVSIISDVLTEPEPVYRIRGIEIPKENVQRRFRKIDHSIVEYVLDKFLSTPKRKQNKYGYLISMLYNARSTMGLHYADEVRRDSEEV